MSASPRLIDRLAAPHDEVLRVLVHEAAIGIVVIDCQARIVQVNQALLHMVNASCDLSPGADALGIFCHLQRDEVWEELRPVLLGARPPRTFISMVPGKDGIGEHTVDVSAVALREADDLISGIILHLSDISVQTRLEARLAQGEKLQAVGQFTSGIAHDFNNLLMVMIGAADEILARGVSEDARADLEQIRSSGERGARLVRELLAFGKQQPLRLETLPVNDAITGLSDLLARLLGGTVRLDLALGEPGLAVRVDPGPFDQVLINLVVNASNAMPAGGMVRVATGHVVLDDSWAWDGGAMAAGPYVTIEVRDTGMGIAPAILPRIFDPFFTTRGEEGGSGLGLSTVHAIIRRFHGFIAVDSELGVGTAMRIYLPRQDSITDDHVAPGQSVATLVENARAVLVVDDDDNICRLAVRALEVEGWQVVTAASAEAALQVLDNFGLRARLCLIVSDVTLPGIDGPALIEAVHRLCPGLPAVLTSGYGEAAVQIALMDNAVTFLSKPYASSALVAMVEAHSWPDQIAATRI